MKIENDRLNYAAHLVHQKADWAKSYRGFNVDACEKKTKELIIYSKELPLVAFIFNNSSVLHIVCEEDDQYIPCAVNIADVLDNDYDYFGKLVNNNIDIIFRKCDGYESVYETKLKNIGMHNLNNLYEDTVYFV